jgi:hypothetical protein
VIPSLLNVFPKEGAVHLLLAGILLVLTFMVQRGVIKVIEIKAEVVQAAQTAALAAALAPSSAVAKDAPLGNP